MLTNSTDYFPEIGMVVMASVVALPIVIGLEIIIVGLPSQKKCNSCCCTIVNLLAMARYLMVTDAASSAI